MRQALLIALLAVQAGFIAVCCAQQQRQRLILHDAGGRTLADHSGTRSASPLAATAALCAASGLVPPYAVDAAAAQQVAGLMQPGRVVLGDAPRAVVLLHLAGAGSERVAAKVQAAWGAGGATQRLDVEGGTPGGVLQAASDLVTANPTAKVAVLDQATLQDCHAGSCLSGHLSAAMHHCGGKHHADAAAAAPPGAAAAAAGLTGKLELPGSSEHLDLSLPAARLFALELAGLQGSAQQALAAVREEQQEAVFEASFVGLQALAAHFPRDSHVLAAAEAALGSVLAHTVEQLKAAFDGDVLFQVALLGDAPVTSGSPAHLLDWKQVARRTLLEASAAHTLAADGPAAAAGAGLRDEAGDAKRYASKATAYGMTLVLIWFTFAGVYCMVSMPFKEDSLLYGRSKAD